MGKPDSLSAALARRIALSAQGLNSARPGSVTRRHLTALASRLGVFQIDSVNVLTRAHTMPAFSRLGAYTMADYDAAAWGSRRAWFEYWGHEACLIPLTTWPLLQWRMRAARIASVKSDIFAFARDNPAQIQAALAEIRTRGALAAADLTGGGRATSKWWGWSDGKRAMEYLFLVGDLTVSHRRGAFERVYDLPERILPAATLNAPVPHEAEAQRALLCIAASAIGIGTERDLRAYWRLKPEVKPRVAELVETGELLPVDVQGWGQPAYLWHQARLARRVQAHALLSPFDPLLFERDRALRTLVL
jgi:uncharacterized protein YcaQ